MKDTEDKKPNMVVCVGISASGKTIWARKQSNGGNNCLIISRDSFRKCFFGYTDTTLKDHYQDKSFRYKENLISEITYETMMSLDEKNVIMDNTHLKLKYVLDVILQWEHMFTITIKVFDVDVEEAIQRDNEREAKVGEKIIRRQYKQLVSLLAHSTFQDLLLKYK